MFPCITHIPVSTKRVEARGPFLRNVGEGVLVAREAVYLQNEIRGKRNLFMIRQKGWRVTWVQSKLGWRGK